MSHHVQGDGADDGTKEHPWQLRTPSGTSEYTMYRDETSDPPALVCTVGTTVLRYQLRALDDLHADPACGTGGMLSVAEEPLGELNPGSRRDQGARGGDPAALGRSHGVTVTSRRSSRPPSGRVAARTLIPAQGLFQKPPCFSISTC